MFDRAFRRVNTFKDFRTKLVEEKEKRAGEELVQEITKKQKVEDDKDKAELTQLMETILDEEEVAIDVIPLAVKSPRIVGCIKNERKAIIKFTSTDGESFDSYYHNFLKLMNLKRNKHFPEKIATGSENRPPMLNKENYVPWSSRLLRYAKSRPNGKLIHNSIINDPYVRRMIPELRDPNHEVLVDRLGYFARNYTIRPRKRNAAYLQTQLLIAQKEEAGIQLQAKEFDLMAATADLNEIKKVNANCILMANLQKASTSGTQTDKAPVYDSDRSTENNNNVISEVSSVEQSGGTVEQHPVNVEERRVVYDSLYNNLAIEVEQVNSVNCKLKETNADLTTELARYKNQEK
nr:hypothetical protein [Tanacetum cinerariifolium]